MTNQPFVAQVLNTLYFLLPDLQSLTRVRSLLMYQHLPEGQLLTYLSTYILAYVIILLVLAALVNERRELP